MTQESGQPWRVLIVDDEENLNWSLVTSLRRERYLVDGALSAESALRRLEETAYDCVVSDVKMPGMDGFELLQWLRRHRPHTHVIMMTAFGSPTARQEALRGGVVAFLEKPFDLRVLKDELRRMAGAGLNGSRGEAEGYDVLDVAQVLHLTRRDIAIHIENGSTRGTMRFLRGELISAEAGALQGDEAFFALSVPRALVVEPEAWDGRTERNIIQSLTRLIFQALAQRERRASAHIAASAGAALGQSAVEPPTVVLPPAANDLTEAPTIHLTAPPAPEQMPLPAPMLVAAPASARSQPSEALTMLLHTIVGAFPVSCGVALLRLDGTPLAQSRVGVAEFAPGAYAHLATSAQAALRALLVADWGALEDMRITAAGAILVVRRLTRGEHAALCVVMLPREADPDVVNGILDHYQADLLAALQ
ncbi:MAG: response regulator [Ktedonobacterales bacterium]|nr:response regulator [Ktedonobacterales bacterium]